MTNLIQMIPTGSPPTQYFVTWAANPLFMPTMTQANATQTNTTQATATQTPTSTSTFRLGLGEGIFFQRPSSGVNPATPQPACADVASLDSQLPQRPTCPMPYHPDVGINRVEHSENAGCKFYVACPARIQGTYNTSQHTDEQVKGYRNGRAVAVHNWAEAQAEWATACLHWHGPVCSNARPPVTANTRVHLNPALRKRAASEQWAVKGIQKFFISWEYAFAAAVERDMHEIHILGSTDEASLTVWAN
ncbi:hypothetical protein K438DRAFT_1996548 [Mycena galopus ATCC 62051]|nr:hypothetical protein K438DRAFT_1996548 [Mycena galopus ATCC 62051]